MDVVSQASTGFTTCLGIQFRSECVFEISGDIILELNGRHVRGRESLPASLSSRYGRLSVAMIPVETQNVNRREEQRAAQGSRVRRARDLFSKVFPVSRISCENCFVGLEEKQTDTGERVREKGHERQRGQRRNV